jgi:hypothetical protein
MEVECLVKAKLKTVDVRIDSVICADPNQIPFSAFIHTAKVLNAAARRSFVSALQAHGVTPRSRDFGGVKDGEHQRREPGLEEAAALRILRRLQGEVEASRLPSAIRPRQLAAAVW